MTDFTSNQLIRLHAADNIGVSSRHLGSGEQINIGDENLSIVEDIAVGHKISLRPIAAGSKIIKYGAVIGSATTDIAPGRHVHLHNMKSDYIPSHTRTAVQHSGGQGI